MKRVVQKGWVKLFPVALGSLKLREAVKIIMTRIYARYEMHLKVLLPYCCVFVSALQVTQCILKNCISLQKNSRKYGANSKDLCSPNYLTPGKFCVGYNV